MSLFCALSFTAPDGERRTVFDAVPRCEHAEDLPMAVAPALARVRREGGASVTLQVADDVTGASLWRARFKP